MTESKCRIENSKSKKNWHVKFGIGNFIAVLVGALAVVTVTRSATLTYINDTIGDPLISASTNHLISFITPSGVDAPTDAIQLTFQGFNLSTIGVGDMDFFHGTSTGYENEATLAATAAAGTWGVAVAGQTVTFTAPTDAAANEVAASSTVRLLIGTDASGGVNQIANPATANNYVISFDGTFGDTGSMGIAIVGNNQVSVTASYPPPPEEPGGGGGGTIITDTTPPVIMNVQATQITETTARITWETDEQAISAVSYGNSTAYASGTISDATYVTSHVIDLVGLNSCVTYYFSVASTDATGNASNSGGHTFVTTCDATPPTISNPQATNITDTSAIITWGTNEPATSVLDYGMTTAYGQQASDGSLVTSHALPIAGLTPNTMYHFRVTSVDAQGNATASEDFAFQTATDTTPPANAALTAVAGDAAIELLWTNPSDADFSGTRIVRRTDHFPANATDGTILYSGSALSYADTELINGTTYFYGAFAYDAAGNFASGSLASAMPEGEPIIPPMPTSTPQEPPPTEPPPTEPPPTEPPPTEPPPTEPPIVSPPIQPEPLPSAGATTTPATPTATIAVNFIGANGTLPLAMDTSGAVGVRAGGRILIRVPAMSMNGTATIVVFVLGEHTFQLSYDRASNAYAGTVQMPLALGTYTTKAQAIFSDGRVAETYANLRVQGSGIIRERQVIGEGAAPIPGAIVRLFRESGGAWMPWDGSPYGERNPVATDANGAYLFEVPPGKYYAEIEKDGFEKGKTASIFIETNVFNANASLIRIPPNVIETISEIMASDATPASKAFEIIQNVGQSVAYEAKRFQQEVLESPEVQEAATTFVPPTTVTLTVVNAASAFSVFNFLSYLQYLFTQPILFLWRRKRRAYGTVYNALTKRPIDLAIIRLIHAESGLIIQTRVTDKNGRFLMTAKPETYRIEVVKPGFTFPSAYLMGKKMDVDVSDLYHGGEFTVHESSGISYNIPLDPTLREETPRRVLFRKTLRSFQHLVAASGVFISAITFLIAPSAITGAFTALQIIIYALFRRLSVPEKPKKFGKIYDAQTQRVLPRAIVRIYDAKFDKLLETQIADAHGRYGFLVGKNVFYLTGEATGYEPITLPNIDTTKGEGVINPTIPMSKSGIGEKDPKAGATTPIKKT